MVLSEAICPMAKGDPTHNTDVKGRELDGCAEGSGGGGG